MHAVDRGPEPPGLKAVHDKLTPKWVAHYRHRRGPKPTDSKWRDFHSDVSSAFFSLCGYCEEICKGDVDHFRPKSRFPERVYRWNNWVLACHVCNNKKGGRWPAGGYVDPCAKSAPARPESYFDFDTKTGELIIKSSLSAARRRKAEQMIKDLGLNAQHHRKTRVHCLQFVSLSLQGRSDDDPNTEKILTLVASRESPLSSMTRAWLEEQGYRDPKGP